MKYILLLSLIVGPFICRAQVKDTVWYDSFGSKYNGWTDGKGHFIDYVSLPCPAQVKDTIWYDHFGCQHGGWSDGKGHIVAEDLVSRPCSARDTIDTWRNIMHWVNKNGPFVVATFDTTTQILKLVTIVGKDSAVEIAHRLELMIYNSLTPVPLDTLLTMKDVIGRISNSDDYIQNAVKYDTIHWHPSSGWFKDVYGTWHQIGHIHKPKSGEIPWYDTTWVHGGYRWYGKAELDPVPSWDRQEGNNRYDRDLIYFNHIGWFILTGKYKITTPMRGAGAIIVDHNYLLSQPEKQNQ